MQERTARGIVPEWTIADRMRKARELTGLSQVEFADRVGLSRGTVNNTELGKTAPRKSVLLLWSMETGVSRVWLETGTLDNENSPDPDGPGDDGLLRLDSNQQPSD